MPPSISIIIPTFNAERYLREMLDSILFQTFDDFEVICIDDESTDSTVEILRSYGRKDSRFITLEQNNSGPGAARNAGIAQARGEYLLFLDSDDFIDKNLLATAHRRAIETGADIVIYRALLYDTQTHKTHVAPGAWDKNVFPEVFTPADRPSRIFNTFQNWPWNKLFKASFLRENGIAFPPLYRTEDLFFTCVSLVKASRIALVDKTLYYYRVNNPKSSTETIDRKPLDFLESALFLKRFLDKEGLFELYRKSYANWICESIVFNLFNLKTAEAYAEVYQALHSYGIRDLGLADQPEELFENSDHYLYLRSIIENDLIPSTFFFWTDERKRYQKDLRDICESKTFKVGRIIMWLPSKIKAAITKQDCNED